MLHSSNREKAVQFATLPSSRAAVSVMCLCSLCLPLQPLVKYVSRKYTQITLSIETLIDMSTIAIKDVTGCLRAVDGCAEVTATPTGGKLLLTEEWTARM